MKEGVLATQHRVMIKCWHVFEGSADLGTAHPPQPQAPRRRRGSPACASQGAKLAAQKAVGSLGMRGVRRKHAPARETARFQKPPRALSRPTSPYQGEGSGVRSAPERLQIDSGFEVTGPGKIKARCSCECHPSEPPCATSRRSERVDRATAGGAKTCAPESVCPCCNPSASEITPPEAPSCLHWVLGGPFACRSHRLACLARGSEVCTRFTQS